MPGPWNPANPPPRPGSYTNWRAAGQPTIQPNLASVVCIPFTHNWGPYKVPHLTLDWAAWQSVYGTDDTPGSRAVKQAFAGENLPGYGGAGAVVSYRFGTTTTSPAASSAVTLNKAAAAAALTLTAKYPGTRMNRCSVTVQTNAQNPANQDLIIFDNQTMLESYTFVSAPADAHPVADLAAIINLLSGFVSAAVVADGTSLINVANAPMVGGLDGATLVAGDWTAAMTAVQAERFSIVVPFDLTDSSILASWITWIQSMNNSGKRVNSWSGGALNETATTAVSRAVACNEPNHDSLGVGGVVDFDLVGDPNAPVVLSTSQLAPRAAGIFAARGAAKPVTFARLPGTAFSVQTPTGVVSANMPTDTDVNQCLAVGIIPVTRDSNAAAPMRLEKGLTTWQRGSNNTEQDTNRPWKVYSNPKFMKVMQDFEAALTAFCEIEIVTPGLPLTPATKEEVLMKASTMLATMETGQLIQPGWAVDFDSTIPSSSDDDFLAVVYAWKFTRSVAQVRNTVVIS